MDFDLSEHAFKPRDPWQFSTVSPGAATAVETLDFSFDINSIDSPFASQNVAHNDLKLPEIGEFKYGTLDDLPSLEQSEVTDDDWKVNDILEPLSKFEEAFDHVWSGAVGEVVVEETSKLQSWETFQGSEKVQADSAYLSEAGNSAFNVAVQLHEHDSQISKEISVIRNDIFLRSLFDLGLGRSSALFRYDVKHKTFERTNSVHNVSGFSSQIAQSIIERLTNCGRLVRHLRDFIDRTYASVKAFPAKVALATSIAAIVDAIEMQLTIMSREIESVLQLQDVFERPIRMVTEVYHLARAVRNARSNEDLASLVYQRCQYCDQEPDWLRSMMLQILARVSRPWLELAEQWIGFEDDIGLDIGTKDDIFVHRDMSSEGSKNETGDDLSELQYSFQPEELPSFMTRNDGQLLFNLGRDLRILKMHHPDHALANAAVAREHHVSLEWQHSWEDVDRVTTKAKRYEAALKTAVKSAQRGSILRLRHDMFMASDGMATEPDFDPFSIQGAESTETNTLMPDELYSMIIAALSEDNASTEKPIVDFSPPTAIMPVLSFNPLLLVQQRVLNAVMTRLLFRSHHLRHHLDLQRHFHLFGDGVFVSQLTAALFDPSQATTERQLGTMRSGSGMGLRLGSRGTWPPASSELRLALMGILSDCYQASFATTPPRLTSSRNKDLPGSLSFAIRQLSEEEAEKILNADSLHALDFLRLQYQPPSPLGAIITPDSMDRYDAIFKFLLRLTRLLFVISHLPRSFVSPQATLFRWQADAFVTSCCKYFFETGVQETWSVFTRYLDSIERSLKEEDNAEELGTRVHEGIEDMRRQHDACLDRISFALLLRTRQQKVMKVLEDILTTVLEFSKLCHTYGTATHDLDTGQVDKLHRSFNSNVKLFLEVCRGLAGRKKGYGKSGSAKVVANHGSHPSFGEENTVERLVATLDYNNFYEQL